ncbi:MAG: hypothetical protein NT090_02755 [Acidobacteria bacterium]|nr:hypothetical protein [Acidobacteriota bacterium]
MAVLLGSYSMVEDGFDEITTLTGLWEWCRLSREGAWRFPEKWGVRGYSGTARIGIVADVPAPRWLGYLCSNSIAVATDESYAAVFDRPEDIRFYELLRKYGLQDAHLMDTHISATPDPEQDERVFGKQLEIVDPVALLVMDMDKRGRGPLPTVKKYLAGRGSPRIYRIFHYRWVLGTRYPWEATFQLVLTEVARNHPEVADLIRVPLGEE